MTKSFDFSASHGSGGKVFGYNYRLHATFDRASEEKGLAEAVEASVIRKMHSHDLGLHVDFLKGIRPEGEELMRALWNEIERVAPAKLVALELERDRHTRWSIGISR